MDEEAVAKAELAGSLGYYCILLSLGAWRDAALLALFRAGAESIPLFGFYLQPAVGGRALPYRFWRKVAEIKNVIAIQIAPSNRYQTLDVIRVVAGIEAEQSASIPVTTTTSFSTY